MKKKITKEQAKEFQSYLTGIEKVKEQLFLELDSVPIVPNWN